LNSETKIGRLKTIELKLREHNASAYLGQGTRIINGVKYNRLLGYRVPSDRVAEALIEKYGRWPKANVFEDEMRGVRYFSDKKNSWINFTSESLSRARKELLTRIMLDLIYEDIKGSFDPTSLPIDNQVLAFVIGLWSADGSFVFENGICYISLTRPFFGKLVESIAEASNGQFHKQKISDKTNDRMVRLVLSPSTSVAENGDIEYVKLSAWLKHHFGGVVEKSTTFRPYPEPIRAWPEEVQKHYCLGYFIGDGSVSIFADSNRDNRTTAKINLFHIPSFKTDEFFYEAALLIKKTLDSNHKVNKGNTNYIGLKQQGVSRLAQTWLIFQKRFSLASCYKTDVLLCAEFLCYTGNNDSLIELLNPLVEVNFNKKPDNINNITKTVLSNIPEFERDERMLDIRYSINSSFFNHLDESHSDNSAQKNKAEECNNRIYEFHKNKMIARGHPATLDEIGTFIQQDNELGQHFIQCNTRAVGRSFLENLPPEKVIERIENYILLERSGPSLSVYTEAKKRNKNYWQGIIDQFVQNEVDTDDGIYILPRLNCKNGRKNLIDTMNRYYKNLASNV